MKHLLFLFPHLRDRKEFGGQRSRHIISCVSKNNYLSTVIIPGMDSMTGIAKTKFKFWQIWKKKIGMKNSNVIFANSTCNDRTSFFRRILYFITTAISVLFASIFIRKVDMVISVSLPVTFMIIGYLSSFIRRVPFIIEVRDIGLSVAGELNIVKKNWFYKFILKLENYLYKSAHIITVSDGFKKLLIKKGVQEEKIHVVKLGFDGYEDSLDSSKFLKSKFKNKFVVLYSGTLGHVFNIPLIIDSAKLLKKYDDILFIFLGGGQNLENFKLISKENFLNTMFLGSKPKHVVSEYCKLANVSLYPAKNGVNINSMLGNKIFDYLGNGCPCIYSGPGGDVADLINLSGGGLVCGSSPQKLAKSILYLYNNRSLRNKMGDSARKFIDSRYKSDIMARKYELVIRNILKKN